MNGASEGPRRRGVREARSSLEQVPGRARHLRDKIFDEPLLARREPAEALGAEVAIVLEARSAPPGEQGVGAADEAPGQL
jgi:hypothetical protein